MIFSKKIFIIPLVIWLAFSFLGVQQAQASHDYKTIYFYRDVSSSFTVSSLAVSQDNQEMIFSWQVENSSNYSYNYNYTLLIDDSLDFSSPVFDSGPQYSQYMGKSYPGTSSFTFKVNMLLSPLPLNETLYWRISNNFSRKKTIKDSSDKEERIYIYRGKVEADGPSFVVQEWALTPITRVDFCFIAEGSAWGCTGWVTADGIKHLGSWVNGDNNRGVSTGGLAIKADYIAGEKPITRLKVCARADGPVVETCTDYVTAGQTVYGGQADTAPNYIFWGSVSIQADSIAGEKPLGGIMPIINVEGYQWKYGGIAIADGIWSSTGNYCGFCSMDIHSFGVGLQAWNYAKEIIPPPSITAFTAEAICQVSVEQPATRLSWSADNADFYNVWRNKQGETIQVYDPLRRVWITRTAWYNISGDITLTNYLDTTANEPGQQYNYYIVAKSSVGTAKSVTKSAIALDCNSPPRVDAGLNKNVWETQSVILEGSASDRDPMTFQWSGACSPYLSDTTILRPNFTAPEVASNTNYDCVLTATDSKGASSSDTMLITVQDTSLSVSLSANPISGTVPLTDVDLTASVSKIGPNLTFNYTFYCNRFVSGTNIISPWDYKRDFVTTNPLTALDVCNYTSAGVKYAKVIVEWFDKAAESRVRIDVINLAPSATNLSVSQPNYCVFSPSAVLSWNFSDPDGHTQSAYQVQVDNNSDFLSPEVNSGKVNLSSNAYSTGPGKLQDNQTYYWRVRVWDSYGQASVLANGPSFSTPRHQYPTADFTWSPQNPSAQEDVQFIDTSVVFGGATKLDWDWTFQNGQPSPSSEQNPLVEFSSFGSKDVTLKITDSDTYACSVKKTLQAKLPLPKWKEVLPQ